MIEQGLRTLLLDDVALNLLVDSRIYGLKLPQKPTLPALVITKIDGNDRYSTEGSTGPTQGRFQIDCWADHLGEARTVSKAVNNILSGYKGIAGDELIQGSFVQTETDGHDWELKTFRRMLDFMVNWKDSFDVADIRATTMKVVGSEQVEVITPGTAVNPSSNTSIVFVRVINNSTHLVACGLQDDEVDATTDPPKGYVLNQYEHRLFAVANNANEVFVDSVYANTKVSIELFAR